MRIVETATDYEIWDGNALFSWCEKENIEYMEKLATLLEISIEYGNEIQSDRDDSIS